VCTDEFRMLNFEQTQYVNPQNGQTYPMYEITRDGFSLLAMKYQGKKAMIFREKFIIGFGQRESLLKNEDYLIGRAMTILKK